MFLLALGVSIFLQAIERFISLQRAEVSLLAAWLPSLVIVLSGVENPKLVLIIGCVGFALNVISAFFLHGPFPFFYSAVAKS